MIATLGDNRLKKVKAIFQYSKGVVDFAQWMHVRLPSCVPKFESQIPFQLNVFQQNRNVFQQNNLSAKTLKHFSTNNTYNVLF